MAFLLFMGYNDDAGVTCNLIEKENVVEDRPKKGKKQYLLVLLGMGGFALLINLLAFSRSFCDFYADHIYPLIAASLGWLTSILPFAIGEILMYLSALAVFASAIIGILCIFLRKKKKYMRFAGIWYRVLAVIFVWGILVYTLNWLTPLRSSILGKKASYTERSYSLQELRVLYYDVVDRLNADCGKVPRDAEGNVLYYSREEAEEASNRALKALSDDYPRLSGYYPPSKTALCSSALRWMSIGGFTYPYTMELTCSKYLTELYYPTLYAHEASHHKGYYRESEANFLSYLALSESGDPLLQYSADLFIYGYLSEAYDTALDEAGAGDAYYDEKDEHAVLSQVWKDQKAAREKLEKLYESESHLFAGLSEVAEKIAKTGWETQADILGEDNYDGVVLLMLDYYDGKLY